MVSLRRSEGPHRPIGPGRRAGPEREARFAAIADHLWRHGYARLPAALPGGLCRALAGGIAALHRQGVPPVAIFADARAWAAARHCLPFARHMLGPDCRMLPHLWAMALPPGNGGRGWPPHADYQGESVLEGPVPVAISLSFWLALSDTGPDNACMHVRPLSGGPALPLPARTGDVLVWRQDLLHWGGRMTRAARGPRVSLALEFQNPAFAPLAEPLLDPERPPPRAERYCLIARQRHKYRHLAPPVRPGRAPCRPTARRP